MSMDRDIDVVKLVDMGAEAQNAGRAPAVRGDQRVAYLARERLRDAVAAASDEVLIWLLYKFPVGPAASFARLELLRPARQKATGRYRYVLARDIADPQQGCLEPEEAGGKVAFVMLNPSTADEVQDDPTIRRCKTFARDWAFDRLVVVNLYAFRATRPEDLWAAEAAGVDIVGPENDDHIAHVLPQAKRVIAAWGAHAPRSRVTAFAERFGDVELWALGVTKDGHPRHPLYLRGDLRPIPWAGYDS